MNDEIDDYNWLADIWMEIDWNIVVEKPLAYCKITGLEVPDEPEEVSDKAL